jgi:hypothetical protein
LVQWPFALSWRSSHVNDRDRNVSVAPSELDTTCTFRMTSSKNSKRSIAPEMKPPMPSAPTNSYGSLVMVSTVIDASGRNNGPRSDHARRVTASA